MVVSVMFVSCVTQHVGRDHERLCRCEHPSLSPPRHHGLSIRKAARLGVQGGQFLDMTLLNPPETDAEGQTRSFSIASGPNEDTLMVATRMRREDRGAVRRLDASERFRAVGFFLAGGIGITPFRSMLVQAAIEKAPSPIVPFLTRKESAHCPLPETHRR